MGAGLPIFLKFLISIIFDGFDFVMIPISQATIIVGVIIDLFGILLAVKLWGNAGYIAAWEVLPFDIIDGFVPSVTIVGLISTIKGDNK